MPNMGVAVAILACLVTACLMGEAYAYSCSRDSDCEYKGCADQPCTSSDSRCQNHGVWEFGCVSALEYFFIVCMRSCLA